MYIVAIGIFLKMTLTLSHLDFLVTFSSLARNSRTQFVIINQVTMSWFNGTILQQVRGAKNSIRGRIRGSISLETNRTGV